MSQTVMITGASRGIGIEVARVFAKAGYNLILTCHTSLPQLQELGKELHKVHGVQVTTFALDLSVPEAIHDLFQTLSTARPSMAIDILINNAGISHIGLFTELSATELARILNTNLVSTMLCSQGVLSSMIRRKRGKIINVSSVWGSVGASMEVAYSTSKAGLHGFTKALAKEVAPSNIQVNALACGLIDTSMNACYSAEELSLLIEDIPANRIGTPTEVADTLLQLAQSSTYLTGQVIHLDGGWC